MKVLGIVCLAVLMIGCTNAPVGGQDGTPAPIETPDVLQEEKSYSSSNGSKWRGDYADIIAKLYSEALEDNKGLAKLNTLIVGMDQIKRDSLKAYQTYSNNNDDYYNVAQSYASEIKDSIVRKATMSLFANLQNQYKTAVSEFDSLLADITVAQNELNDQLILMKLFVTKPMIEVYQKNELPAIKALESVLTELKRLTKESEQFTSQ